jgi:hypothetical protein
MASLTKRGLIISKVYFVGEYVSISKWTKFILGLYFIKKSSKVSWTKPTIGSIFEFSSGIFLSKLKAPFGLSLKPRQSINPSKLSKAYNFFTYLEKKLVEIPL